MTDTDNNNLMREAAKLELQSMAELRQMAWNQHSSSYRWLNASLLAINGGAIVAILAATGVSAEYKRASGIAFVIGILLALASGRLGQTSVMKMMPVLQSWSGYWIAVASTGVREPEAEAELRLRGNVASRWAWLGQAADWISTLAFIAGALIVGNGLK